MLDPHALEPGPILSETWARLRSRPLVLLSLELAIFLPAWIAQLIALHGLVLAADSWLDPTNPPLPFRTIATMITGVVLFVATHLFVRPVAELGVARIALDQPLSFHGVRAAFLVQLRRWALPWILVVAPLAIGARFVIVLKVLGALDATSLLYVGAIVVWVGFLALGVALWIHLRAAMAFAAVVSGDLAAPEALEQSAARLKQHLIKMLMLAAILIAIDLAITWIAAEIPSRFSPELKITQLSAADLRARLPELEPLQAWIFVATGIAAMFSRLLSSIVWARAWIQVRGTNATPT